MSKIINLSLDATEYDIILAINEIIDALNNNGIENKCLKIYQRNLKEEHCENGTLYYDLVRKARCENCNNEIDLDAEYCPKCKFRLVNSLNG